jgi:hypothetical protein
MMHAARAAAGLRFLQQKQHQQQRKPQVIKYYPLNVLNFSSVINDGEVQVKRPF